MDRASSFILPLAAALLYVVAALLVKRSSDFGIGVWRMAFLSNLLSALIFQVLLPFGGNVHFERLWQPALAAVLYLLGQLLNYAALHRGDVSVATPVLGLKIILVALFSTLLATQNVPGKLWAAAVLSSLAIALLNWTAGGGHHHLAGTICYSGAAACAFALFDVLVQKWSPTWGAGRFLPIMLGFVAGYSLVMLPRFRAPLWAIPRNAWPWLLGGCGFIGLQSLVFVIAIVQFQNATAANVIYSSRGLWSVVAVWGIGHWFSNRERDHGTRILRWRLAGAVSMTTAIVLVLLG